MSKLNAMRQFAGGRMLLGFLVGLNIAQYILVTELELCVSDGRGSVGVSNTEQLAVLFATVLCYFAFYWFYKTVVSTIPGPEERKSNILPAFLCGMLLTLTESPRELRRLHTLRRWSHEQEIKQVFLLLRGR